MKRILFGLVVAGASVLATSGLAADEKESGGEKPKKETYYVVKTTKYDKTASVQVLTKAELTELQKKLKFESMVIGQAMKATAAEWNKPDADGKKGPPFPLSTPPPARTLKVVGQSADNDKANTMMEKEAKKCDEAQARIDKAAQAKRGKVPEARRKKLEEKESEMADALSKVISKIEELAWAKETEASSGGPAPKSE